MNFFWKRCCICGDFHEVEKIFIGESAKFGATKYYHDNCLKMVLCNPCMHSNRDIAFTIAIKKKIRESAKHRKELIANSEYVCVMEF